MDKTKKNLTARITTTAILCAISLVTFVIENAFPPLFLPGAKMGLPNIFSLFALVCFGYIDALIIVLVRTTLGSLIVGNLTSLIYSMSAGVISLSICALLFYALFPKVSLISISIVGAVCHNLIQNLIFCWISQTPKLFSYMPYLAIIGVISGAIVGLTTLLLIKKIPSSAISKAFLRNK